MKLLDFFAAASLLAVVSAQTPPVDEDGDGLPDYNPPNCAALCFIDVMMSNPELLNCGEANMYLCFCNSFALPMEFQNCVCEECDEGDKATAMQFGLDTCIINGAPINWLDPECPA